MPFELPANPDASVYADADAVDSVAALRVGGAAWRALTSAQKEQVAATVSALFDALDYRGARVSSAQQLEWPRTGTEYSTDAWPSKLVQAAIEYAILLAPSVDDGVDPLSTDDASAGTIKREKVGPIETEYVVASNAISAAQAAGDDPLATLPPIVQLLLGGLLRVPVTDAWGSAAVIRSS